MTGRCVTFQGNSKRAFHLPPRDSVELASVEVANNAFVEKLVKRRIIALLEPAAKKAEPEASRPQPAKSGKSAAADLSKMKVKDTASPSVGDDAGAEPDVSKEPAGSAAKPKAGKRK